MRRSPPRQRRARGRRRYVRACSPPRPRPAGASRVSAGRFIRESWGELKKVEWPGRSQVIQGTIVVIIACAIVGTYLYAADQIFKPFVRNVLLGQ